MSSLPRYSSMRALQLLCLAGLWLVSAPTLAGLELPRLFSEGMVLQRGQPVHVWGWATPGKPVRVRFDGHAVVAVAAASGRWDAQLPEHAAGGPYRLSVEGDGKLLVFQRVLVGDVWVCSGQSNMEFSLSGANDANAVMAAAHDPWIRHFKIPRSWADAPQEQLAGGAWIDASPRAVGEFTAVGYFFARELRARFGVPIGLINATWGGSSIEAWMDGATLGMDAAEIRNTLHQREADGQRRLNETHARLARWPDSEGKMVKAKAGWGRSGLDESSWADIPVEKRWEESGYYGMDGFAWYRSRFQLSAAEAAGGIALALGTIDDSDQTWVNGKLVGGTHLGWNRQRLYKLSPKFLHAGSNLIAIRVEDAGGGGGLYGPAQQRFVETADGVRHPLADAWKFRPERVALTLDDDRNQYPAALYNKMIHPLLPFPVKGVIWYQGETNANAGSAYRYRERFTGMIRSWRSSWFPGGDFPFLWAQLPNFVSGEDVDGFSPWATLRDSQSAALALPRTAQAVIIDVGDPADIHPRDKQDVGHRLALAALHVAYGENLVYSGPTYDGIRIEESAALVSFGNRGGGLAVRGAGKTLEGFSIAGADGRFVPAHAVIQGDAVRVWSEAVRQPASVSYAWSDNPQAANLINREGLPASPFRTDDQPGCPMPLAPAGTSECVVSQEAANAARIGSVAKRH